MKNVFEKLYSYNFKLSIKNTRQYVNKFAY